MSESAPRGRHCRSAAPAAAQSSGTHRALHVTLVVASFFISALVVELLTFSKRERDLGLAALEIDLERQKSEPLTFDRADHFADLLLMQQEFPRPCGLVIEVA